MRAFGSMEIWDHKRLQARRALEVSRRRHATANKPHTHDSSPNHLTIQLINWQVLAGKDSQIREEKLAVACHTAQNNKVDIIMGTELGTTPMTEPLKEGPYISDWSTHPYTKAGQGVGAFFSQSTTFNWVLLSKEDDDTQSRFYHLKHNNQNLLLGIFYAPPCKKITARTQSLLRNSTSDMDNPQASTPRGSQNTSRRYQFA